MFRHIRRVAAADFDRAQTSKDTYTEPLDLKGIRAREISDFLFEHRRSFHQDDVKAFLEKYEVVRNFHAELVPTKVAEKDFWERYCYRCNKERIMKDLELEDPATIKNRSKELEDRVEVKQRAKAFEREANHRNQSKDTSLASMRPMSFSKGKERRLAPSFSLQIPHEKMLSVNEENEASRRNQSKDTSLSSTPSISFSKAKERRLAPSFSLQIPHKKILSVNEEKEASHHNQTKDTSLSSTQSISFTKAKERHLAPSFSLQIPHKKKCSVNVAPELTPPPTETQSKGNNPETSSPFQSETQTASIVQQATIAAESKRQALAETKSILVKEKYVGIGGENTPSWKRKVHTSEAETISVEEKISKSSSGQGRTTSLAERSKSFGGIKLKAAKSFVGKRESDDGIRSSSFNGKLNAGATPPICVDAKSRPLKAENPNDDTAGRNAERFRRVQDARLADVRRLQEIRERAETARVGEDNRIAAEKATQMEEQEIVKAGIQKRLVQEARQAERMWKKVEEARFVGEKRREATIKRRWRETEAPGGKKLETAGQEAERKRLEAEKAEEMILEEQRHYEDERKKGEADRVRLERIEAKCDNVDENRQAEGRRISEDVERQRLVEETTVQQRLKQARMAEENRRKEERERKLLVAEAADRRRLDEVRGATARKPREAEETEQKKLVESRLEEKRLVEERLLEGVKLQRLEQHRLKEENLRQDDAKQQRLEQKSYNEEQFGHDEVQGLEGSRLIESQRIDDDRLREEKLSQDEAERHRIEEMRRIEENLGREKAQQQRLEQQGLNEEQLRHKKVECERQARFLKEAAIVEERLLEENLPKEYAENKRFENVSLTEENLGQEDAKRSRLEVERLVEEKLRREYDDRQKLREDTLRREEESIDEERLAKEKIRQEQAGLQRLAAEAELRLKKGKPAKEHVIQGKGGLQILAEDTRGQKEAERQEREQETSVLDTQHHDGAELHCLVDKKSCMKAVQEAHESNEETRTIHDEESSTNHQIVSARCIDENVLAREPQTKSHLNVDLQVHASFSDNNRQCYASPKHAASVMKISPDENDQTAHKISFVGGLTSEGVTPDSVQYSSPQPIEAVTAFAVGVFKLSSTFIDGSSTSLLAPEEESEENPSLVKHEAERGIVADFRLAAPLAAFVVEPSKNIADVGGVAVEQTIQEANDESELNRPLLESRTTNDELAIETMPFVVNALADLNSYVAEGSGEIAVEARPTCERDTKPASEISGCSEIEISAGVRACLGIDTNAYQSRDSATGAESFAESSHTYGPREEIETSIATTKDEKAEGLNAGCETLIPTLFLSSENDSTLQLEEKSVASAAAKVVSHFDDPKQSDVVESLANCANSQSRYANSNEIKMAGASFFVETTLETPSSETIQGNILADGDAGATANTQTDEGNPISETHDSSPVQSEESATPIQERVHEHELSCPRNIVLTKDENQSVRTAESIKGHETMEKFGRGDQVEIAIYSELPSVSNPSKVLARLVSVPDKPDPVETALGSDKIASITTAIMQGVASIHTQDESTVKQTQEEEMAATTTEPPSSSIKLVVGNSPMLGAPTMSVGTEPSICYETASGVDEIEYVGSGSREEETIKQARDHKTDGVAKEEEKEYEGERFRADEVQEFIKSEVIPVLRHGCGIDSDTSVTNMKRAQSPYDSDDVSTELKQEQLSNNAPLDAEQIMKEEFASPKFSGPAGNTRASEASSVEGLLKHKVGQMDDGPFISKTASDKDAAGNPECFAGKASNDAIEYVSVSVEPERKRIDRIETQLHHDLSQFSMIAAEQDLPSTENRKEIDVLIDAIGVPSWDGSNEACDDVGARISRESILPSKLNDPSQVSTTMSIVEVSPRMEIACMQSVLLAERLEDDSMDAAECESSSEVEGIPSTQMDEATESSKQLSRHDARFCYTGDDNFVTGKHVVTETNDHVILLNPIILEGSNSEGEATDESGTAIVLNSSIAESMSCKANDSLKLQQYRSIQTSDQTSSIQSGEKNFLIEADCVNLPDMPEPIPPLSRNNVAKSGDGKSIIESTTESTSISGNISSLPPNSNEGVREAARIESEERNETTIELRNEDSIVSECKCSPDAEETIGESRCDPLTLAGNRDSPGPTDTETTEQHPIGVGTTYDASESVEVDRKHSFAESNRESVNSGPVSPSVEKNGTESNVVSLRSIDGNNPDTADGLKGGDRAFSTPSSNDFAAGLSQSSNAVETRASSVGTNASEADSDKTGSEVIQNDGRKSILPKSDKKKKKKKSATVDTSTVEVSPTQKAKKRNASKQSVNPEVDNIHEEEKKAKKKSKKKSKRKNENQGRDCEEVIDTTSHQKMAEETGESAVVPAGDDNVDEEEKVAKKTLQEKLTRKSENQERDGEEIIDTSSHQNLAEENCESAVFLGGEDNIDEKVKVAKKKLQKKSKSKNEIQGRDGEEIIETTSHEKMVEESGESESHSKKLKKGSGHSARIKPGSVHETKGKKKEKAKAKKKNLSSSRHQSDPACDFGNEGFEKGNGDKTERNRVQGCDTLSPSFTIAESSLDAVGRESKVEPGTVSESTEKDIRNEQYLLDAGQKFDAEIETQPIEKVADTGNKTTIKEGEGGKPDDPVEPNVQTRLEPSKYQPSALISAPGAVIHQQTLEEVEMEDESIGHSSNINDDGHSQSTEPSIAAGQEKYFQRDLGLKIEKSEHEDKLEFQNEAQESLEIKETCDIEDNGMLVTDATGSLSIQTKITGQEHDSDVEVAEEGSRRAQEKAGLLAAQDKQARLATEQKIDNGLRVFKEESKQEVDSISAEDETLLTADEDEGEKKQQQQQLLRLEEAASLTADEEEDSKSLDDEHLQLEEKERSQTLITAEEEENATLEVGDEEPLRMEEESKLSVKKDEQAELKVEEEQLSQEEDSQLAAAEDDQQKVEKASEISAQHENEVTLRADEAPGIADDNKKFGSDLGDNAEHESDKEVAMLTTYTQSTGSLDEGQAEALEADQLKMEEETLGRDEAHSPAVPDIAQSVDDPFPPCDVGDQFHLEEEAILATDDIESKIVADSETLIGADKGNEYDDDVSLLDGSRVSYNEDTEGSSSCQRFASDTEKDVRHDIQWSNTLPADDQVQNHEVNRHADYKTADEAGVDEDPRVDQKDAVDRAEFLSTTPSQQNRQGNILGIFKTALSPLQQKTTRSSLVDEIEKQKQLLKQKLRELEMDDIDGAMEAQEMTQNFLIEQAMQNSQAQIDSDSKLEQNIGTGLADPGTDTNKEENTQEVERNEAPLKQEDMDAELCGSNLRSSSESKDVAKGGSENMLIQSQKIVGFLGGLRTSLNQHIPISLPTNDIEEGSENRMSHSQLLAGFLGGLRSSVVQQNNPEQPFFDVANDEKTETLSAKLNDRGEESPQAFVIQKAMEKSSLHSQTSLTSDGNSKSASPSAKRSKKIDGGVVEFGVASTFDRENPQASFILQAMDKSSHSRSSPHSAIRRSISVRTADRGGIGHGLGSSLDKGNKQASFIQEAMDRSSLHSRSSTSSAVIEFGVASTFDKENPQASFILQAMDKSSHSRSSPRSLIRRSVSVTTADRGSIRRGLGSCYNKGNKQSSFIPEAMDRSSLHSQSSSSSDSKKGGISPTDVGFNKGSRQPLSHAPGPPLASSVSSTHDDLNRRPQQDRGSSLWKFGARILAEASQKIEKKQSQSLESEKARQKDLVDAKMREMEILDDLDQLEKSQKELLRRNIDGNDGVPRPSPPKEAFPVKIVNATPCIQEAVPPKEELGTEAQVDPNSSSPDSKSPKDDEGSHISSADDGSRPNSGVQIGGNPLTSPRRAARAANRDAKRMRVMAMMEKLEQCKEV